MSLPGVSTDPESDGAVGVDHVWKRSLEKAMKETPLAASLIEAIQGMRDLDGKVDVFLEDIVKGKRKEWVDFIYSPEYRSPTQQFQAHPRPSCASACLKLQVQLFCGEPKKAPL